MAGVVVVLLAPAALILLVLVVIEVRQGCGRCTAHQQWAWLHAGHEAQANVPELPTSGR